jgi:UDP-glucuronate 4-epimerase
MQQGDVAATFADHRLLETLTGFRPGISVEDGVAAFVTWYLERQASLASV